MRFFIAFLVAFLALSEVALSTPYGDEDALLEDIFRASLQEDDNDGDDVNKALNALTNGFSSIQDEDEEGGGDSDMAEMEGFISRVGKIFKILKKIGNVLHSNFGNVPVIRKYSKYLRCLPTFQEQIELATAEDDGDDLEMLLNSMEAQAQSEEDIAEVEFFKKVFKKAKRFGRKIWKKAKKIGGKALKVIRAVRNYLRCIKRSIEVKSKEEAKQVERQAINVLQRAITGRLVRI